MKNMKKRFANLSSFLLAAALAVALSACLPERDGKVERPKEFSGPGERVIVDELSLWNNQGNSGISYGAFEPLRVRTNNAEYYHRTGKIAASGMRYGEIRLTQKGGSLLYLPRYLSYDADDQLKILFRVNGASAGWRISVYPTAGTVAHVTASTAGIHIERKGEWNELSIPLDALSTVPYVLDLPKKEDWRNPDNLLSVYKLPAGYLYGIEFSLDGGKAGDALLVDRMVLVKNRHTQPNIISGRLVPATDAEIHIRSDKGDRIVEPSWNGAFEAEIPQGASILEIVAQTKDKVISPRAGRFVEVGTYMPKMLIPTGDPSIEALLAPGNSNESLYLYEEKFGPRLLPNLHFLTQVSAGDDLVVQTELKTNQLGYLDRDRRADNPDDAYRVMVLGECHHMGLHVTQSDMWWNEAEAVATMRAKRPVEFISISNNHASWTSSWPAFRDFSKDLKPDIVLLPIVDPGVLNLVSEEYMMDWLGGSAGHRTAYQFELGADGKLIHKPNDPDWQLYRSPIPEADHKRIREQYVSSPYIHADAAQTPEWVKQSVALSTATLREFVKLAKQRGARFGILYISIYGSSKTEVFEENGQRFDPRLFRTLMRGMAEESGAEFIDIADELHLSMDNADGPRVFFLGNGHFTPYAHYRYGQVLGNLFSSWADGKE